MNLRNRRAAMLVPIAVLALAAGCERTPTSPDAVAEAVEFDALADFREDPRSAGPASATGPSLHALFRAALRTIEEAAGADAAGKALERVIALRQEARAAYEAGDVAGARAKLLEARQAMARVVIRAYGPQSAERVLGWVDPRVDRLRQRQAQSTGESAERLARMIRHLDELTRVSRAAAGRGNHVAALDYAARAAEALSSFLAAPPAA